MLPSASFKLKGLSRFSLRRGPAARSQQRAADSAGYDSAGELLRDTGNAWLQRMAVQEELSVPIARLFEIHEQSWFPQSLRDEFVDSLQMILEVTDTYQPIATLLRSRLEECGSERVVDLCSGAGGPWPSLVRHFEMHGAIPPEVLLTDKYPTTTKLQDVESPATNRIQFLRDSVDATRVPKYLRGFRTLFSSFHHLNPDEARGLLQDSVNKRQAIGVFEAPACHTLTFLSILLIPIGTWLFVPFRRPFRWSRLLWTYLIPVVPFVLLFDGVVSCLRAYSVGELQEMTSGLESIGYRWEIGEKAGGWLPVRITYLIGRPQNLTADAAD